MVAGPPVGAEKRRDPVGFWKLPDRVETILALVFFAWVFLIGPGLLYAAEQAGIDWQNDPFLFTIFTRAYVLIMVVIFAAFFGKYVVRVIREEGAWMLILSAIHALIVILITAALRALLG